MNSTDTKIQRDRFLAFAFSCTDLMLEISPEGKIAFALGASKSITGFEYKDIIGQNWMDLFSAFDQSQVQKIYETAKTGKRAGPLLVDLNEMISKRKAVFTALRMPDNKNFYVTLGFSNMAMSRMASQHNERVANGDLLDRPKFIANAEEVFDIARSLGQDLKITLYEFDPTQEIKDHFDDENWGAFIEAAGEVLCAHSVNGQSASLLGDGRFSILHEDDVDMDIVATKLKDLAKEFSTDDYDPPLIEKTIQTDLDKVSTFQAERALSCILTDFADGEFNDQIITLNFDVEMHAQHQEHKLKKFIDMIKRQDFKLYFQPIIDLKTKDVHHYEILSRFTNNDTSECVMFIEVAGLALKYDLSVCDSVINYIKHKGGSSRSIFSINISGYTIQDDRAIELLKKELSKFDKLHSRLLLEITGTHAIKDMKKLNKFITTMQEDGYKIILSNFGTGEKALQLLQKTVPDMIKVDEKFIAKIAFSKREEITLKNLRDLCAANNIKVIAPSVETNAQAETLIALDISYGQGLHFGAPENAPSFTPTKK